MEYPSSHSVLAARSVSPSELTIAALAIAAFLALNLVTSERSPVPWTDEVMFADPAINLAEGRGFVTSAWRQPSDAFFAGNSPLYPSCLGLWISCTGISPTTIRSLDYVLIVAVCLVLWHMLKRRDLIRTRFWQVMIIVLLVCGNGTGFCYRSGRYDCLGMLVVVGLVSVALRQRPIAAESTTVAGTPQPSSIPGEASSAADIAAPINRAARWLTLLVLCALIPCSGLQLLPYVGSLGLAWLYYRRRQAVPDLIVGSLGLLLGAAGMCLIFNLNGVWPLFVRAVNFGSGVSRTLADRIHDALFSVLVDPSRILIVGTILVLLCWQLVRRRWQSRELLLVTALFFGIVVPAGVAFVGMFPIYYSWMAYAPAIICLGMWCERAAWKPAGKWALAAILALACVAGLPARMAVTLLEWDLRDPAPVRELAQRRLTSSDVAYSDFSAYYAVKAVTNKVIVQTHLDTMPPEERDSVSVIVTNPDSPETMLENFGPDWSCVEVYDANRGGEFSIAKRFGLGSKPYKLGVYRRSEQSGPHEQQTADQRVKTK